VGEKHVGIRIERTSGAQESIGKASISAAKPTKNNYEN
jgi:hypothetical protein